MSWDLFVQEIPAAASRVDEIPETFEHASIGTRASVLAVVREVVPFVEVSDPSWVEIRTGDIDVEVNLGDDEVLASLVLEMLRL